MAGLRTSTRRKLNVLLAGRVIGVMSIKFVPVVIFRVMPLSLLMKDQHEFRWS